jgi:methyltransferase (TIGR00027 family)
LFVSVFVFVSVTMIIPKVSMVLVAAKAILPVLASEKPLLRLTEVQSTSLLVAFWRKIETQRSSMGANPPSPSLCKDEQATVLLDALATSEQIEGYATSLALPIGINIMAIRTRTIDDWLMEKAAELRPRQVVNLGAGMCTRPYRLPWSSNANATITVFEVDDSHLLQTKHNVLRQAGYLPRVPVVNVAGDVTKESLAESLLQAGFDPKLPTDWIAEGLLEYLPLESHRPLFQLARKLSAPGSRFVGFQGDPWNLDYMDSVLNVKLPFIGLKVREDIVEDFRAAGWSKNITVLDDYDFQPRYGRTTTLPVYLVLAEAGEHEAAGSDEL